MAFYFLPILRDTKIKETYIQEGGKWEKKPSDPRGQGAEGFPVRVGTRWEEMGAGTGLSPCIICKALDYTPVYIFIWRALGNLVCMYTIIILRLV